MRRRRAEVPDQIHGGGEETQAEHSSDEAHVANRVGQLRSFAGRQLQRLDVGLGRGRRLVDGQQVFLGLRRRGGGVGRRFDGGALEKMGGRERARVDGDPGNFLLVARDELRHGRQLRGGARRLDGKGRRAGAGAPGKVATGGEGLQHDGAALDACGGGSADADGTRRLAFRHGVTWRESGEKLLDRRPLAHAVGEGEVAGGNEALTQVLANLGFGIGSDFLAGGKDADFHHEHPLAAARFIGWSSRMVQILCRKGWRASSTDRSILKKARAQVEARAGVVIKQSCDGWKAPSQPGNRAHFTLRLDIFF